MSKKRPRRSHEGRVPVWGWLGSGLLDGGLIDGVIERSVSCTLHLDGFLLIPGQLLLFWLGEILLPQR